MGIFKNSRSHYIEDFTVHIFQDQKKIRFQKKIWMTNVKADFNTVPSHNKHFSHIKHTLFALTKIC